MARVTIVDPDRLAETAAERLTALIEAALAIRDRAAICLTGGSTPRALYRALADPADPWRQRIAWHRLDLYWGDERCVPPEHRDSNYGMAYEAMVQHVPLAADHVHRMRGEADPPAAAAEYASVVPQAFDVMLLGLGEDCHLASIFPGSPLLAHYEKSEPIGSDASEAPQQSNSTSDSSGGRVVALNTDKGWRITLTPPAILRSDQIVMLVGGAEKATAVARVLEGTLDIPRCPAQLLRANDARVEWIIDTPAAAQLRNGSR